MDEAKAEIVIIEDDPHDAELLLRLLKKNNVSNKITILKDGADAVDYFFAPEDGFGERKIKIVLVDLKLPKISGIEVIEKLKKDERTRQIPVIVLTSSQENQDVKRANGLGVNGYLTKPMDFEAFFKIASRLGIILEFA